MFSQEERCIYRRNPLDGVICQLRFPEILSIGAAPPVAFQEAIRDEYPQYAAKMDSPAPKITGRPGNFSIENQPGTVNYHFTSEDGIWRINLTSRFISLTCTRYTCWEEFARQLDKPLVAFIKVYKPAYFERVGLRYINFISRKKLGLENTPLRELFSSIYLGPLADETVNEGGCSMNKLETEVAIRGGCRVKIHAAPGMIKRNPQAQQESVFIWDQDLFMPGKVQINMTTGSLQTLHAQAYSIFRGAISDRLHEALEPEYR